MEIWKVMCDERSYPGMWRRWFMNQCVAVGWKASWGCKLRGETQGDLGWRSVRKTLGQIEEGDKVIVHLHGHRLGRIGEVTGKAIEDTDWDPLVPPTKHDSDGEMGRRVFVRWDLTAGPTDMDMVVQVPKEKQLSQYELRHAVCKISSKKLTDILEIMKDPRNWVGLTTKFGYEKSLSEYIATYPHRIEDGLEAHPNLKVRERVFGDGSRLDVLLIDRDNRGVIVECKQYAVTKEDIAQLRHYMKLYKTEEGESARGILVHGGAQNLTADIRKEAARKPEIQLVQYRLDVDFFACY